MSDQDRAASAGVAEHAPYVLGSEAAEVARLEAQARTIEQPTAALLRAAGIGEGMRVLDLGTGLGHVSLLLAELVGPSGEVVGIDRDPRMLEHAEQRRAAAGVGHVRYVEGDARTFRDAEPFDAVVERLVLFHLPDAVEVVRHHVAGLRPDGMFVAIEFDVGAARTEPPTELPATLIAWMLAAFRAAKADPTIGSRLELLLPEAGLVDVGGFGIQGYLAPRRSARPGHHRRRDPVIGRADRRSRHRHGGRIDLPTLETRIAAEVRAADAIIVLPTVSGAFGRRVG